jgi:lipopolysaccharide biosynthesis glycosyltransferase
MEPGCLYSFGVFRPRLRHEIHPIAVFRNSTWSRDAADTTHPLSSSLIFCFVNILRFSCFKLPNSGRYSSFLSVHTNY